MSYWRLPSQRRVRPAPTPAPRVPAIAAALEDEFHARPFGLAGETTAPRPPAPPPRPVRSFEIEPWPLEEQMQAAETAQPSPPRPSAIEELMAREMAIGAIEEPRPLGPPAPKLPPLPRIVPPPPDWRAEEEERLRRAEAEKAAAIQDMLEPPPGPEQPTYPAKPKKSVPGIL